MKRIALVVCLLLMPIPSYAQSLAGVLTAQINAACGNCLTGLSIGSETDKATWLPVYSGASTGGQRTAAAGVISAFSTSAYAKSKEYTGLIAGGLQITSTGTPSLSGTYAVDQRSIGNLQGLLVATLTRSGAFPGGTMTYGYPDIAGTPHTVNAAQLSAIGAAISDFLAAASTAQGTLEAGQSANWPASSVTIP